MSPTCSSASSTPASRVVPAQGGQGREVLPGGERRVEPGPVDESRDAVGDGERPPDRRTQDLQAAAVRDRQAQQQTEERRLARTVRADQAVDLTSCHVEVDAVERDHVTEGLPDPATPDCGALCMPVSLA